VTVDWPNYFFTINRALVESNDRNSVPAGARLSLPSANEIDYFRRFFQRVEVRNTKHLTSTIPDESVELPQQQHDAQVNILNDHKSDLPEVVAPIHEITDPKITPSEGAVFGWTSRIALQRLRFAGNRKLVTSPAACSQPVTEHLAKDAEAEARAFVLRLAGNCRVLTLDNHGDASVFQCQTPARQPKWPLGNRSRL